MCYCSVIPCRVFCDVLSTCACALSSPAEYFVSGQCSEKTDVFAFGVFLMELISGKDVYQLSVKAEDDDILLKDWVCPFSEFICSPQLLVLYCRSMCLPCRALPLLALSKCALPSHWQCTSARMTSETLVCGCSLHPNLFF